MMKILVIEPDRAVAWLLQEELRDAGFGVRVCQDVGEAAQSLRGAPFDVLLGDADGMVENLNHGLRCLADDHNCDCVLLGPRDRQSRDGGPVMIRKSADLAPLINVLSGFAIKAHWLRS